MTQCRDMPGYPKVDRQSDYLIARYDGAVLDAKPWGRGALEPAQSAQSLGYTGQQAMVLQQLLQKEVCLSQPLGLRTSLHTMYAGSIRNPAKGFPQLHPQCVPTIVGHLQQSQTWHDTTSTICYKANWPGNASVRVAAALYSPDVQCSPVSANAAGLRQADLRGLGPALQRRHPLALGHYANHPPPGKHPNALVAAYDYPAGSTGEWGIDTSNAICPSSSALKSGQLEPGNLCYCGSKVLVFKRCKVVLSNAAPVQGRASTCSATSPLSCSHTTASSAVRVSPLIHLLSSGAGTCCKQGLGSVLQFITL